MHNSIKLERGENLSDDKITVDEPMISTDVDQMIQIISQKKKLKLNELQHLTNIDKKNVEKWVRVLEDEGYISIEYGITGTFIVWTGTPDSEEDIEDLQANNTIHSEIDVDEFENELPIDTKENENVPVQEDEEVSYSDISLEDEEQQDAPQPDVLETVHEDEEQPEENVDEMHVEEHDVSELDESLEFPSFEDEVPEVPEAHDEVQDEEIELADEEQQEEEQGPENLLEEYVSRTKKHSTSSNSDLKSNILGNLDDEIENTNQLATDVASSNEEAESDDPDDSDGGSNIRDELLDVQDEPEIMETVHEIHDMIDDEVEHVPEVKKPPKSMFSNTSSRELINAYMKEINREKAEIAKLRKEKDSLYRDKLSSLEARMEADLATLTHHVLERQSRIADIKGNVLALPDKVDEVERLQQQMNMLGDESRDAVRRTSEMVGGYLKNIQSSRDAIETRIEEGKSIIGKEEDKLHQLERLSASTEAKTEKIRASMDVTKAQLEELSENMKGMLSELEEATEMKVEITDMTSELKQQLEKREEDLDSLETDLEEIAKIEHWAMEYLNDYEKKIAEIEEYVAKSEDELLSVRESAEGAYMKRYLRELESLTDSFNDELSSALQEEENIDERIASSKEKLTSLVKESQAVISKLHGDDDGPDFETLKNKVKKKSSKTRKTVSEKSGERKKLVEDVKKRRSRKGRKKKKK